MHTLVLAIIVSLAAFVACRKDGDDDNFALKWSCARVHATGAAVATPECLAQMKLAADPALKRYKAVPQTVDGKVTQYALVERPQPH